MHLDPESDVDGGAADTDLVSMPAPGAEPAGSVPLLSALSRTASPLAAGPSRGVTAIPLGSTPVRDSPGRTPPVGSSEASSAGSSDASSAGSSDASSAGSSEGVSGVPVPPAGAVVLDGLTKRYSETVAVDRLSLVVPSGSMFGFVGPNGAGKTTTLMMVSGLLRPSAGRVLIAGADLWKSPRQAKAMLGVLPDPLRLFDRLTGRQLLSYAASLRGLDRRTTDRRTADLADAIGFVEALDRPITDYSSGMAKKVALAAAMIHRPRVLVLDEPFEGIDPVSTTRIIRILRRYADGGGTVVMSSHSIELVERSCDAVGIVVRGELLASGSVASVCDGATLEERFVELAGGHLEAEGLEWLGTFSN